MPELWLYMRHRAGAIRAGPVEFFSMVPEGMISLIASSAKAWCVRQRVTAVDELQGAVGG